MILGILMAKQGWGNHTWTIPFTKLPNIIWHFYIFQIMYIIVEAFTKLSILLFYLRIFPQKWFVRSCIVCIYLICISDVAFMFIVAFQCKPVDSLWNRSEGGKCLDQVAVIYAGGGCSVLEHLFIILIPIPCINQLKVGKGKKISLFVMFSVGTLYVVVPSSLPP